MHILYTNGHNTSEAIDRKINKQNRTQARTHSAVKQNPELTVNATATGMSRFTVAVITNVLLREETNYVYVSIYCLQVSVSKVIR